MALVQRYLMEVAWRKVSFFRSYGYLSVKCIPGVNLHIVKFASFFPEILSPEIVFLSHERHIKMKSIEKANKQTKNCTSNQYWTNAEIAPDKLFK